MIKYKNSKSFDSDIVIDCEQIRHEDVIHCESRLLLYEKYPDMLYSAIVYDKKIDLEEFINVDLYLKYKISEDCVSKYCHLINFLTNVKQNALNLSKYFDKKNVVIQILYGFGCKKDNSDFSIVDEILKDLFENEVDVVLEICKI